MGHISQFESAKYKTISKVLCNVLNLVTWLVNCKKMWELKVKKYFY